MKLLSLIFLFLSGELVAQNVLPHTRQPPPQQPHGSFTRSIFIDCTDQIIDDMLNNHSLGLENELIVYLRDNFIGYAAMDGLQSVLGDPVKESVLRQLLLDIRSANPGIEIAAAGNSLNAFGHSFLKVHGEIRTECQLISQARLTAASQDALRVLSFFEKSVTFDFKEVKKEDECSTGFDALYLRFPFWKEQLSYTDAISAFNDYIIILEFMKTLKCRYSCIQSVDAEFVPNERFIPYGWTATDQVTAADELIDRVIMPGETDNGAGVYAIICRWFHLFTDRFTKDRTRVFIGFSAESNRFVSCAGIFGRPHLGDYLDQTGNMYSAEQIFVDQLNDPNYRCAYCNCNTNAMNQYSITNTEGNELTGSIWFSYSIMKNHRLFRTDKPKAKVSDILGRTIR